ncbi:MAG TPA: hypothetical protein VIU12_09165 [Chryseolinea sp.]
MSKTPPHPSIEEVAKDGKVPLAIEFHDKEGRIQGFHYGHLLNYMCDKNPKAEGDASVPSDRFSFWFSTHDVVVLGWRLSKLAPLVRHGLLEIIRAVDAKFYGVSDEKPFICEIVVSRLENE